MTAIWLVGELKPDLPDTIFPKQCNILSAYFHKRIVQKTQAKKAIHEIVLELKNKFQESGLKSSAFCTIRLKIGKLVKEYNDLKKNKKSHEVWQVKNEQKFVEKMNSFFDVYQESSNKKVVKGK
jgi:hypothetical protein